MARIKGGMNARRKHNRVLKLAKGYRGARSKQYRTLGKHLGSQCWILGGQDEHYGVLY